MRFVIFYLWILSSCSTLTPLGTVTGSSLDHVKVHPDTGVWWQGYWLARKDAIQSVVWSRLSMDGEKAFLQMWNLNEPLLTVSLKLRAVRNEVEGRIVISWDITDVQRYSSLNPLPSMKPGSIYFCRVHQKQADILERNCSLDLEPSLVDPYHQWFREK